MMLTEQPPSLRNINPASAPRPFTTKVIDRLYSILDQWYERPFQAWARYRAKDPEIQKKASQHNNFFFEQIGVSRDDAYALYAKISKSQQMNVSNQDSFHRLAFAALVVSGFKPKNILELGTSQGYTTRYLAELFPDATVYTLELPKEDPLYEEFNSCYDFQDMERALIKERLNKKNIVSIRLNTVLLLQQNLPDMDLIWLDAGHYFPEVAWDHVTCLSKLRAGGWLFSDDVRLPGNRIAKRNKNRLDAYRVIQYLNKRLTKTKFELLLKYENPAQFVYDQKFVAFLRTPR